MSTVNEEIIEINIKKKKPRKTETRRGRKPKEVKVPKKRGRKPKPKDPDKVEKKPKKRGRKPKKTFNLKELPKTFFEENNSDTLVLLLPNVKLSDLDNDNNIQLFIPNDDGKLTYKPTVNNIQPYDNQLFNTDYEILNKKDPKERDVKDMFQNIFEKKEEKPDLKNKKHSIKLEEKNEDEYQVNLMTTNMLKEIRYQFINANKNNKWPEKTNLACLWCFHRFDTIPIALPEKYNSYNDTFYLDGCFCSFNCAAAYNFDKKDHHMWERYSLLNLLYRKINKKFIKIKPAPPREALKIVGGYMSIEEYRNILITQNKEYTLLHPPMISIIPKIEETLTYSNIKSNKNAYVPLDDDRILKAQESIKKSKKKNNNNKTLQDLMDLKIS